MLKTNTQKEREARNYLLEFFGQECPHCLKIRPIVEQVENELNVRFSKLEVWHSEDNQRIMQKHSEALSEACGGAIGVPCFFNIKTGKALCGEVDKKTLIEFAKEK